MQAVVTCMAARRRAALHLQLISGWVGGASRLVHQLPCEDGRVVFVRDVGEGVGSVEKHLHQGEQRLVICTAPSGKKEVPTFT